MNNLDLDHIAVNTNDIKESVSWYVDKFGAEIEYIDETWALLAIGKTKLALTIPDQHPATKGRFRANLEQSSRPRLCSMLIKPSKAPFQCHQNFRFS